MSTLTAPSRASNLGKGSKANFQSAQWPLQTVQFRIIGDTAARLNYPPVADTCGELTTPHVMGSRPCPQINPQPAALRTSLEGAFLPARLRRRRICSTRVGCERLPELGVWRRQLGGRRQQLGFWFRQLC